MDFTVRVQDCTLQGSLLNSLTLTLPVETLTARELIRRYVLQVIEQQQAMPNGPRYRFFSPTADEAKLNGYDELPRRVIDAERHYQLAIAAFERNGFLLLVDEQQVDELDEPFRLSSISNVQFLRLLPLVGG